ncbi:hypothetical protein HDU96_007435 [Phlyctochytrium bullatum]|nr:hypothetical protein HDU96_007435 [Phlyctochytrium bullatum]
MEALFYAFELAAVMRSVDLLDDIRKACPFAITDDLTSDEWKTFLFASVENGFCYGLSIIPQKDPVLFDADHQGQTAIKSGHVPPVELLAAKGAANLDLDDDEDEEPLFIALQSGNLEILRLLLQDGAKLRRLCWVMGGLCFIPNELLRLILFHLHPDDLIALASVNHHLRHAVALCIDFDVAAYHVTHNACEAFTFNHPLLFEHSIAVLCRYNVGPSNAEIIWGDNWHRMDKEEEKSDAIRLHRVKILRAAVQRGLWPLMIPSKPESELSEEDIASSESEDDTLTLGDAVEMAVLMKSLDFFNDLRNAFPDDITDDLDSAIMREFLFGSASVGFCDGLSLIPQSHPILRDYDGDGTSLFGLAIHSGHAPTVELLLSKGVPVNQPPNALQPKPHLFLALEEHNLHILRLILECGADMTIRYNGETALHRAARKNRPECLKVLLEFGADIEARSDEGVTPLGTAARSGQGECLSALLNAGADVDAVDEGGKTALAWATFEGRSDTVRFLVDRGASVNPASSTFSPLYAAVDGEREHIMISIVETLLEAGADANWRTSSGATVLHHALSKRRAVTAKVLLDAGADPTIKCNAGFTPLQRLLPIDFFWNEEWEELLELLIEKGADLQERDTSGKTIWQKLCKAGRKTAGLSQWVRRWSALTEQ